MIIKGRKWWALKEEWGRIQGTKEAEIINVKLLDKWNRPTDNFKVGEDIKIKAKFIVNEEIKEPYFGIAIFRENGLYCYGPNTIFDGYIIEKLKKGEGWFGIRFKEVNLTAGDYRLSIAIWDKKGVWAHSYHPGFYKFKILGSPKIQHLLHLPYQWKPSSWQDVFRRELHSDAFDFIKNRWKEKFDSKETKITSVEFLDEKGNIKDSLNINDKLVVRVSFKISGLKGNTYLWVGISRKDGIYCHGSLKRIRAKENRISLVYQQLPLLPAEYRISVGILPLDDNKGFLSLHHGSYPFKINSKKLDYGIVYLKHFWKWQLP